jgi:hypothetical protein
VELLEWLIVRPRQVRYQAALRPDMIDRIDSKALSNFISTPTPASGLEGAQTVLLFLIAP